MAVNRLNVGATNQLLAKASTGQSTNILELQGTAGTTLAGVDASGNPVGSLAHPPTFKNLIINGAMQVYQRGTSVTGVTATSYNTADRWKTDISSLGTWTQTVENDAPTGSGFRKSLKMLCTTADASPAAGDYLVMPQAIEGQNLQHILKGTSSAKQLTLSFWVKSNVTGTYIAELYDPDNTRSVSQSYTVSASATWEKKTITFPADTTGALDNNNDSSLSMNFWLGAGTTYTSGTLNTSWASVTNANRAVGGTNLAAATNNYWQITGVQLEVGSVATEFEFKPADVEIAQCQRYYYRNGAVNGLTTGAYTGYTIGYMFDTNSTDALFTFPVQMRATPTMTFSGIASHLGSTPESLSTVSDIGTTTNSFFGRFDHGGSRSVGQAVAIHNNNNTSGFIAFSIEL